MTFWACMRAWEKVFLVTWAALLVQAPLVIASVILGGYLGWWKT